MAKTKLYRHISKNYSRGTKRLRIIKLACLVSKNRVTKYLQELTTDVSNCYEREQLDELKYLCEHRQMNEGCSVCTKELQQYCVDGLNPSDWDL